MEFIKKVYNYYKTKKGKRVFFFGFYFLFFLFLAILILTSSNNNYQDDISNDNDNETINNNFYSTEKIENNSYHYKYTININNEIINYEGIKDDKQVFDYENDDYLDFYYLKRLIKNSKYLYKTTYPDETVKFFYEIENSFLYEEDMLGIEEGISNITITSDKDLNLTGITIDLHTYFEEEIYEINLEYNMEA